MRRSSSQCEGNVSTVQELSVGRRPLACDCRLGWTLRQIRRLDADSGTVVFGNAGIDWAPKIRGEWSVSGADTSSRRQHQSTCLCKPGGPPPGGCSFLYTFAVISNGKHNGMVAGTVDYRRTVNISTRRSFNALEQQLSTRE